MTSVRKIKKEVKKRGFLWETFLIPKSVPLKLRAEAFKQILREDERNYHFYPTFILKHPRPFFGGNAMYGYQPISWAEIMYGTPVFDPSRFFSLQPPL